MVGFYRVLPYKLSYYKVLVYIILFKLLGMRTSFDTLKLENPVVLFIGIIHILELLGLILQVTILHLLLLLIITQECGFIIMEQTMPVKVVMLL